MSLKGLTDSVANFGFHIPLPGFGHVFSGFEFLGILLVTAIPFGIYDLVEAIDNVESAAVAGDSFPTTRVLTADGVVSLIGCMMGNPFINAVYIGHPGWKAMGGRIGYSAATGIMVILLCWFGTISVMLALDSERGDPAHPALHRHADRFASVPGNAQESCAGHHPVACAAHGALGHDPDQWRPGGGRHGRASAQAEQLEALTAKMNNEGVLYHGLQVLGGGSILGGLILGAIAVFHHRPEFQQGGRLRRGGRES